MQYKKPNFIFKKMYLCSMLKLNKVIKNEIYFKLFDDCRIGYFM